MRKKHRSPVEPRNRANRVFGPAIVTLPNGRSFAETDPPLSFPQRFR